MSVDTLFWTGILEKVFGYGSQIELRIFGWFQIFDSLKERGVNSVGIIVSDGLKGLDKPIAKSWSGTAHQKCIVYLQRNLQALVRREDKK